MHGGHDSSLHGERPAQLEARLSADDRNPSAERGVHVEPQPCARGNEELCAARDVGLVLVGGIVRDAQPELAQLGGTDPRVRVEPAANREEDSDPLPRDGEAEDRDIDVDREDVFVDRLLGEDLEARGEADRAGGFQLAVGQQTQPHGALQPRRDPHGDAAPAVGAQAVGVRRRRAGRTAIRPERAVGHPDLDGAVKHALVVGGGAFDRERAIVVGDGDAGGDTGDLGLGGPARADLVVRCVRPLLDFDLDAPALDPWDVALQLQRRGDGEAFGG